MTTETSTVTAVTKTPKELKAFVLASLKEAHAAPSTPQRASGCGRAYVCISADRATVNAVAASCKTLGLLFLRKNYGAGGNAIYIGYDNGTGGPLAKAEAFAKVLNDKGIRCYTDAASD